MFPHFYLNLHRPVEMSAAWDLHVYDASVNIVSWRACLPDNTVSIITDWPHMSSKHLESHVRAHCVISSIYPVTILNRRQGWAREDKGGVENKDSVTI